MESYYEVKENIIGLFHSMAIEGNKPALDAGSLIIDDWFTGREISNVFKLLVVNKTLQLELQHTSSYFIGTLKLLNELKSKVSLLDLENELSFCESEDLKLNILVTNTLIKNARMITDPKGY
jgi:hypothetical protein